MVSFLSKLQAAVGQQLPNPLGYGSIPELLQELIRILTLFIAPPIVALMVLYAGLKILTSSGDPKKVEDARKIILYATVGYVIILIGWGFVSIIKDILL